MAGLMGENQTDSQDTRAGETVQPGGFQTSGYVDKGAGQWGDPNIPGMLWTDPSTYQAATGSAAQRGSSQIGVTDDMLVQNRLAGIMQSPVGKIARDVALQFQNSRGMMDSSQAQQAIVQASIQAGLPIAQKDAEIYFNTARENVSAENAAASENQAAQNTMTSLNMNAQNAAAANNAIAYNQHAAANQQAYGETVERHMANTRWNAEFQRKAAEFDATFNRDAYEFDQQNALNYWDMQMKQSATDAELATNKMAFLQSVASAGMDADSTARVLWAAYGVGMISEDEVHSSYAQLSTPIVTTAA
jgi:hypothetical protein